MGSFKVKKRPEFLDTAYKIPRKILDQSYLVIPIRPMGERPELQDLSRRQKSSPIKDTKLEKLLKLHDPKKNRYPKTPESWRLHTPPNSVLPESTTVNSRPELRIPSVVPRHRYVKPDSVKSNLSVFSLFQKESHPVIHANHKISKIKINDKKMIRSKSPLTSSTLDPMLTPVPYAVPCGPLIRAPSSIILKKKFRLRRTKKTKNIDIINPVQKRLWMPEHAKANQWGKPTLVNGQLVVHDVTEAAQDMYLKNTINNKNSSPSKSLGISNSCKPNSIPGKNCQTKEKDASKWKKIQYKKNPPNKTLKQQQNKEKLLKMAYEDQVPAKISPNGLSTSLYNDIVSKNNETKRLNKILLSKLMKAKSTIPSHVICK